MIRLALLAVAFVGITAGLLVFQPGNSRRAAPEPMPEAVVTRAEPGFAAIPDPEPEPVDTPTAVVGFTQPVRSAPAPTGAMDDDSLRRMTWDTLSNLNHATGRESAPGQPGSLLHTIVRRSLDDQGSVPAPSAALPQSEVYVVQPGDSLVAIAERVYGDVNMTGPLFAANQGVLARPDDLRPGLTLVLPAR